MKKIVTLRFLKCAFVIDFDKLNLTLLFEKLKLDKVGLNNNFFAIPE